MKKLMVIIGLLAFFGNAYSQWTPSNGLTNNNVTSFSYVEPTIFATLYEGGIFKSTDNGANWNYSGLDNRILNSSLCYNNKIYAGASTGIFYSANNGLNWSPLSGGLPIVSIKTFSVSNSFIFAGGFNLLGDFCLFKSSNNGVNWSTTNLINQTINALTAFNNLIFAGTYNGIYISSNQGSNWILSNNGLTNHTIWSITRSDNNIYTGTNNGIYLTSNQGQSWVNISNSSTSQAILSVVVHESKIIVGTYSNGIYLSTDQGTTWLNKNQGFNQIFPINVLIISNNFLIAGTRGNYVWRRLLSEIIGIQKIGSNIPDKYSLSQNYPNPFNPSTNIKYQITNNKLVTLKVFDILGKEIATLVKEKQNAGTYEATFDGSGLTSGIYFYRLTCGDFSETKRMVLIK
ncbi:MAG: T9SS type A sorting domain-containing protein [Ignavibacteriae bacterium]|nr:T9SS type A sorting domain-containing protein [Ignavibacteriota bacterium]